MWKNLLLGSVVLVPTLVFPGCSTPHTVILKDGSEMQTQDGPQLNERTGFYEFVDINGKKVRLNPDEIRAIHEAD